MKKVLFLIIISLIASCSKGKNKKSTAPTTAPIVNTENETKSYPIELFYFGEKNLDAPLLFSQKCEVSTVDSSGFHYCLGTALSSTGADSNILIKTSPQGEFIWYKYIDDRDDKIINSFFNVWLNDITIDTHGNIFIIGETTDNFGETNANEANIGSIDATADLIVLKLSSINGDIEWVKQLGDTGVSGSFGNELKSFLVQNRNLIPDTTQFETGKKILVDSENNLICIGTTSGSIDGTDKGAQDIYVLKLNQNGNILDVKQYGIAESNPAFALDFSGHDNFHDATIDPNDNIYIASSTWSNLLGPAGGDYDVIVFKLNKDLSINWIKQFGDTTNLNFIGHNLQDTTKSEQPSAIALNKNNEIFISGTTRSNLIENNLNESYDIFLIKLQNNGDFSWAKHFSSSNPSYNLLDSSKGQIVSGMAIQDENIYISGNTNSSLFEQLNNNSNIFILKTKDSPDALTTGVQVGVETKNELTLTSNVPIVGERCNTLSIFKNHLYCGGEVKRFEGTGSEGLYSNDVFIVRMDLNKVFKN